MATLHHKNVLFFLSVLVFSTSCQKNHIPSSGHFTHYHFEMKGGRSIASVAGADQSMDPKQIYLDCRLRDYSNLKTCFKFQTKELKLSANFETTQKEVQKIADRIIVELKPNLEKYAKNRSEFCDKNSTLSFEKCLYQFLDKESVELTNLYQKDHEDLNGQEYLFIKEKITNRYKTTLAKHNERNRKAEVKKINQTVSQNFNKVEEKLLSKTSWIHDQKFLPDCHNYCIKFAINEMTPLVSRYFRSELKNNEIIEEKCADLLSHSKVLEEINKNTNLAIEKEVSLLSRKIGKNTFDKSIECFEEKRIYNSEMQAKKMLDECIHKTYNEESKNILGSWKNNQKENSFFAKNSDLIMGRIKLPTSSLRRDIASRLDNANP